jgi:hypothetical protein
MGVFSFKALRGLFQALERLVRGLPPPPAPDDVQAALDGIRRATPEQLEAGRRAARRALEQDRSDRGPMGEPPEHLPIDR